MPPFFEKTHLFMKEYLTVSDCVVSDDVNASLRPPPLCALSGCRALRRGIARLASGPVLLFAALFLLFSLLLASTAHAQTAPAAPTGLMAMTDDGVGSGNAALGLGRQ